MKGKIGLILLVALVSVVAGITLVAGIHNCVQASMAPVLDKLVAIEANQKVLTQKLSVSGGGGDNLMLTRLTAIENQLNALQGKITEAFNPPAPAAPPQEDFNKVHAIDIGSSPILGKKDAPITIVEFTDLQCPFCARFYPPIKEVLKAYPDKVRFVMKNFPLDFHPNARPAAKLALAAHEQGKYYEMVDLLLDSGASVAEDKVKEYAKQLKLNYKKLMDDLKNKEAEYEKRINEDMQLGGSVEVQGTPTFYLNGKKTVARDFAKFKEEIDQILAAK